MTTEPTSTFTLRFSIGLAFAWAITLTAFEWRTPVKIEDFTCKLPVETIEIDEAPVVILEKRPATPLPQPMTAPQPLAPIPVINLADGQETDDPDPFPDYSFPDPVLGNGVDIEPEIDDDIPVTYTGQMPQYLGGEKAMLKDLYDKIKYPEEARANGISGTVYVTFVVEKDGSVSEVSVERGVYPSLDKEALAAVKGLKRFTPGYQGIKPVRVKHTIPISFRIK